MTVPEPAEAIRGIIAAYGTSRGDFRKNVAGWIEACLRAGGLPQFRTRYAGKEWDDRVLVACYGRADQVPGGFFENVPREDIERMEREVGDFRFVLEKYGTAEQRKLLERYKPPRVGIIRWITERSPSGPGGR